MEEQVPPDYCVLCQESHKMGPNCFICKECGGRGHLAKDCAKLLRMLLDTDSEDGEEEEEPKGLTMAETESENPSPRPGSSNPSPRVTGKNMETLRATFESPRPEMPEPSLPEVEQEVPQIELQVMDGGDGLIKMSIIDDPNNVPKATVKPSQGLTVTKEQRAQIVTECCDDLVSPTDLARKWNCNPDTIRSWVRRAGRQLPKQYKKSLCLQQGPKKPGKTRMINGKILQRDHSYTLVCCHLETLRSSASPSLNLTQLAAVTFSKERKSIFRPILPSGLTKYLNSYKLGGDLLQALNMTEDDGVFLFRRRYEVARPGTERLECVEEREAISDLLDFLEAAGPGVILVCVDEDTVSVLVEKLKALDKGRVKRLLSGYTWWRRILKYLEVPGYSTCELEDFHTEAFPSEPSPKLHSSAVVAEVLCRSVEEIINRHLVLVPDESLTGELVAKTGVSSDFKPKAKNRDVVVGQDIQEVLEVYSSFRPEVPTFITADQMEQVDIESDDDVGEGFQVVAKKEYVEGDETNQPDQPESPILILSDSEEDDVVELPVCNEARAGPSTASGWRSHDGSIMMSMNDPDDIPKAVVKPPMSAGAYSPEQRARIMREVLEERISPADLGKKYGISAHAIRDWIKKAGHALPKSYKRRNTPWASPYPMGASATQGMGGVTTGAMTPPTIESPSCSSGDIVELENESLAPVDRTGSFMGTNMSALISRTSSDLAESQDNSPLVRIVLPPPAESLHAPAIMPEQQQELIDISSSGHSRGHQLKVGDHWSFTKRDFIECPVCSWRGRNAGKVNPSTQVKICNVAKHFMKVHHKQQDLVNKVRGCQGCGAEDVPVQLLGNHQDCSMKKLKGAECATGNETCQRVSTRLIKLNFISEVNGAEEIMIKRFKPIEEKWVKRNASKHKKSMTHRSNLKFLYKGKELDILATPESLCMQNGDVVTVELRDKDKNITIKFVSTDATFIKSVKKTTTLKGIKKIVSKIIGVQDSEIKFSFNNKKVRSTQTPALLNMRQNDIMHVWKFCEEPNFPIVNKRKASEGPDQVTDPKVSKLNQDISRDIKEPRTEIVAEMNPKKMSRVEQKMKMRLAALNYTEEQRGAVVKEVVEDHYDPDDLGKKYQISALKIRDWVRIAGHSLPGSYGKDTGSGFSTEGQECVSVSSSEEEEEVVERDVTESEVNRTKTTEEEVEGDEVKSGDGEQTGSNNRESCVSTSEPSSTSTSGTSPEASLGLKSLAAASAQLKDQRRKPLLDVLKAWVLAPDSLYRAKCPECGYIPAPTLGALYQHMIQHHPEVSRPPRTCNKCGNMVSPLDVETHFQNHDNVLAKQVSKSIHPQNHPAPVLLNGRPRALLPHPVPWSSHQNFSPPSGPQSYRHPSGPQSYRQPSGPQTYRPPSGPQSYGPGSLGPLVYRPLSDPPPEHVRPPNMPVGHFYPPYPPWPQQGPGQWAQLPPGHLPRQSNGPRWRH